MITTKILKNNSTGIFHSEHTNML